ncbi:MAG: T9SS type A sorting domain-containing protein [Lewinellaceae bacterium]|nr:T9SS type A sorting domain-containing protein [Lewinellaceae bacterium]
MSNTDIKFYTTAYGDHERALYFPPAAALNPQLNTGNTWAGANTNLDAFYDGPLSQAQNNAPFQTQMSNINSSKINPQDWFFLTGTDPSCTQTSFNCPNIIPPNEFTELTEADLVALDTTGKENEHVLRFQQKRQLYRKLKENPDLIEWSQQVEDFYAAAQNGIVGAFDSLDQAYEQLHELSPSLESSFTVLIQQIDSLAGVLSSLHAQYPTATPGQQQTLLEQERALNEAIGVLQDDLNNLQPSVESEFDGRVTQLLAQNDTLDTAEVWEVNEKNINDLYFRHYTGLIDTFSAGEKGDIETLALACPQYEGIGVYKARQLYEMFADSIPSYDEHDCQAAEERAIWRPANEPLTVAPNPADEYLAVRFGKLLPEGSRLAITDITGGNVMDRRIDGASEITLNVASIPQGIYLISIHTPESALKIIKVVITH